jgi:hypothetical protein
VEGPIDDLTKAWRRTRYRPRLRNASDDLDLSALPFLGPKSEGEDSRDESGNGQESIVITYENHSAKCTASQL